ncbi:alpha/beta hydrolase [Alteromonas sp. a30]|uniref:alpha/beta hydrolase n=1 Tax=Alteromonas sp. a30 TaxID=2730917 RepID=UPI002281F2B7|nr:alpha/beta hydrolase [Alteromonas sp. a30]MCY7296098.1 alpha/beta hydrolase [Alteromonas sp. a30]
MPQIKQVAAVAAAVITSSGVEAVSFPEIASNVPYDAVTALPFQEATHRLAYGEDSLQYGKLWISDEGNTKPLVVFIHGGCWLSAYDIQHSYPLTTAIAQAGYHVWSLEYRRTGDTGGGWPGTYEDILAGIDATNNLTQFGVEVNSVVLMGHSAGGHLAVLAGSDWQAKEVLQGVNISGVIGLAAITDLVKYSQGENSCETATPQFMGGRAASKADAYTKADPAQKQPMTNTVLLHGNQDAIVNVQHASLKGAKARLNETAGHFDWVHPGSQAFTMILSTLESLSTNNSAQKPE